MLEHLPQERGLGRVLVQVEDEGARLGGDDPARPELLSQLPVKAFLMEDRGRSDGVRGIHEDDVELFLRLPDEDVAVADDEFGAAAGQGLLDPAEMLPAGLDDQAVDLDHPGPFDRVLEDLPQGAAVPSSDDQDLPRGRMGGQSGMDEHLVVVEFVLIGRLDEGRPGTGPARNPGSR